MDTGSSTSFGSGATRVLAVIGLIAVIIIGMWGSVKVASAVPGTLSAIANAFVSLTQIFVPANETISLSAPTLTVLSGQPVTLTYTHAHKSTEGQYTFRYACVDGVTMTTVSGTGTVDTIACNTAYAFPINGTAVTVTPVSATNRYVDIEVFVDYTPTSGGSSTVTGSTVLTVENDSVSTSPSTTATNPTPTTPKPKPTTVTPGPITSNTYPISGTGAVSNPNGYVDLTANIIEVGVVDKTTGAFTASSTPMRIPPNARVAVRFAIQNIGTKTSPQFTFSSVLPTIPSYTFFSQSQQALAPGDRIEYTIGFDSFVDADTGTFIVNVDPTGTINEKNENNNIISYAVNIKR